MISIVVPMYRESEVLQELLQRLSKALEGESWELVAVDDGSPDGTGEALSRLSLEDPRVVPVLLSRNFGKEAALAAGLELARGEAVVVMDADLQHPPELIPALLERWREGFDVVDAVKEDRGREPVSYRLAAAVFYGLMGRAVGPDFAHRSDFKLLDRQVVDALGGFDERNRFFRGMVAWVGFKRAEVPFAVQQRAAGKTGWSTLELIRYSLRSLIAFSSLPLIAISWLGFITTAAAALLSLQTLWNWARGVAVSGFTTTIISVLIMGGAILVCLGVVAAYLSVIYDELKGRPTYVRRKARPVQISSESAAAKESASPSESRSGQ